MKNVDWSLYLVTDQSLSLGRALIDVVAAAVQGGVSVVQLREKECSTREFVELGRRVQDVLRPRGVPLIINDRLDVMMAIGADGLHIGQSDLHYLDARRVGGEKFLLGLSVENRAQVDEARDWNLSYVALSPLFATPTKTDTAAPWGLEGLATMSKAQTLDCPLVVIGGIHAGNAMAVRQAGADGLAVVSAICSAPSPYQAALQLRKIIDETSRSW